MNARTSPALTVVLPFLPQDEEAHLKLIAAACRLHGEGGWNDLNVIQLVPEEATAEAAAASEQLVWWNTEVPGAGDAPRGELSAMAVLAALARPELAAAGAGLLILPAGPVGEELASTLAARLGAANLGRCIDFVPQGGLVKARRTAFGGRLMVELLGSAGACCATWRPQGDVPTLVPVDTARIRRIVVEVDPPPETETELLPATDGQARLEGARIVVSGGRGMAGPEGFELLGRIAECLGGAVGGSLPAVDEGWVPVARQVGQSGRFVSPKLYFAVGISGTPQHLAGIAHATRIVALNKDPEALIFAVADVGVVGDWHEMLPLLADRLETSRAASTG